MLCYNRSLKSDLETISQGAEQHLISHIIVNPTPADLRQIAQRKDIEMIQVFIKNPVSDDNLPYSLQTLFDLNTSTTGISDYSSIEKDQDFDLLINRIDDYIITSDQKQIPIKNSHPFKILDLMIRCYPKPVDDEDIKDCLELIEIPRLTITKHISNLRKIVGEKALPKNSRALSHNAKISIIRRCKNEN